MENPYNSPSSDPLIAEDLRRPVGVSILSVLTGMAGLGLLGAFVVLVINRQEINEYALSRRTAPSLLWVLAGLAVVLTMAAAVGMWRGRKWGWWIACAGIVFSILNNILLAATANLSGDGPSLATFTSVDSLKYVVRGIILVAALAYWLRDRVRRYFRVEKTGRIKAVVLAGACSMGVTLIITVVMQTLFLFRTR